MQKKKNPKKNSPSPASLSEKAMFNNPVASVNDATGYSTVIPQSESESESLTNLINTRPGGEELRS